jgi:hypothetical protein
VHGYTIKEVLTGSYLVRSEEDRLGLVVPLRDGQFPLARVAGGVGLTFRALGSFRFDDNKECFDAPAAVVECIQNGLEQTFMVLARDVAQSVAAFWSRPTAAQVSQALGRWERLLRGRRVLSSEEELGLWGELWFMTLLANIDRGLAAWRGPEGDTIDFVGGGIGVDCKTSRRAGHHFVSQEQLERPVGDYCVYLCSLFVAQDPVAGRTINELIDEIGEKVANQAVFEEKILLTGYSRADAASYTRKLALLEKPSLFPIDLVPRVRVADPGVTDIRFTVDLNSVQPLADKKCIDILAHLIGE